MALLNSGYVSVLTLAIIILWRWLYSVPDYGAPECSRYVSVLTLGTIILWRRLYSGPDYGTIECSGYVSILTLSIIILWRRFYSVPAYGAPECSGYVSVLTLGIIIQHWEGRGVEADPWPPYEKNKPGLILTRHFFCILYWAESIYAIVV